MSLVEEFKNLQKLTAEQADEIKKLQTIAADYKEQIAKADEAHKQELAAKQAEIDKLKADNAAAMSEVEKAAKTLAESNAQIDKLQSQLRLEPFIDVTPGQKPVKDGSAGVDQLTDNGSVFETFKKMDPGSPEAQKFYREHKEEIDKHYA